MEKKYSYQELKNQVAELEKQNQILRLALNNQPEKKIEEKLVIEQHFFKTLMDNIPDYIYFKDKESRFIKSNKAQAKNFGLKDPKEMIGKTDFDFFTKERAQEAFKDEQNIIRTGCPIISKEEKEIWIDGSTSWSSTTKIILNDHKGEVIGTFGLSRNISKQKDAEEKLLKLNEELKEINTAKDKLFSIIGHDLRGPSNNIIGLSTQLLENIDVFDKEEIKMFLVFINSAAQNTTVLLENLLNWANTQTGKIVFNPQKVCFSKITQEVILLKNSIAESKNISLNQTSADKIEVLADKNMLKVILRNLISNAIKFTNSGGKIEVTAIAKKKEVEITVSDNGVGINEDMLKKLFKSNTKSTTLGTAKEIGTGLGLLLCKEFIEKHGGKIWVESTTGKGSDFKFTLPNAVN
ncbi:PAS domain-containing sensor histidine kinase [Polaribacter sp.]|uniref:PAS domain-containing sensor histidine kinase n=1 Tax=Polaribacter sp. TaxID=1920175 RepID=UPI003F6BE03D